MLIHAGRHGLARLRTIAPERLLIAALAVMAIGCWVGALTAWPRPLTMVVFAVGDGDALLLRAPNGRTVLVDGGSRTIPDVGTRVLVPNLLLLGVRRLDAIVITHPDSDHVNGLIDVVRSMPVGLIVDPELPGDDPAYHQVVDLARSRGIPWRRVRAGDCLNLSREVRLEILAPHEPLLTGTSSDTNNNSLLCRVTMGATHALLAGDLQAEGVADALARTLDLRASILKVAHHGSRSGTDAAWLARVQPRLALISCAGNSDHPHRDVLARLRDAGCAIARTDVEGQLRMTSDGRAWRVRGYHRHSLGEY